MKLQTQIANTNLGLNLDYESNLLLSGSCFAENIGKKLSESKFNCTVNPLGISYNPLSLFNLIERSLKNEAFKEEEFLLHNERFFSFDLHSDFSSLKKDDAFKNANSQLEFQKKIIQEADCLILSLGTAWVHVWKENNLLVNNCHKLPSSNFDKNLIDVKDIVEAWESCFEELNKDQKIVFTISPVRHLKDGFHENQLSKSTLLLAVNEICNNHDSCFYFPSYEIMMDELRDYRFYDKDLVHPSEVAIDLIWDHFQKSCLSTESQNQLKKVHALMNSYQHKAFEPKSGSHQSFLKKLKEDFIMIQAELKIDLKKEIEDLENRIEP